MNLFSAHVKEIEAVAAGQPSGRDPLVVDSWMRCVDDYRLNPGRRQPAYIVPVTRLREHQQQAEDLVRISRTALDILYQQVAGYHYILLLSDAAGISIAHYRDPVFDSDLRKAGLYMGADWSESLAGTCAVGACVTSCQPITVHQDDHFNAAHIGLTCSAAPVFDTLGRLAAVVDISQLRSAAPRDGQQLARNLVTATARRIELANLVSHAAGLWVLRLSRSPDFVDSDPEAAIAVDGDGMIRGMTHAAFGRLPQVMRLAGGSSQALIGQPISTLFDLDSSRLPRFTREFASRDRIVCVDGLPTLFLSAEPPALAARRRAPVPALQRKPVGLPESLRRFAGHSRQLYSLMERAGRFVQRDLPILIQGETGTGKELLARALHAARSKPGPFVAVNCAAIPEQLVESELFGYLPNSFTGAARAGKTGLIDAADGGTLFLDEIGDMPVALQSRLLRVLAERCVAPIGAVEPHPVDIYLISATHVPLRERVAGGAFREDLFYRLNAASVRLPPLRERDDLDALVDTLLDEIGTRHDEQCRLSAPARKCLHLHRWPGNLRELRNALEVACALAGSRIIAPEDLPEAVSTPQGGEDLSTLLADCGGNVSELARRLGVDRSTVHRRLKRLQLR
ncbi:MAG TPA: sigma-54-dependent Fis family transcriptional regulator [Nevskiaceae bacterium]|nr:sigma-54-dependent Fis family transcriptional regulator [Nevskiaceae bacterium]